jgi:hypothetical protein
MSNNDYLVMTTMDDYLIAMTWKVYSRVHDSPNGPYLDEKSAVEVIREVFTAGRSHQAKLDMIAICNRADEIGGEYGDVLRDQAITALDEAAKGE